MTIRPAVDLAFTRANIPLHPTIETNSIEFMKQIARSGQAITFLNPVDVAEDVEAGEIRHLPLDELAAHPIALKLMVRARGGLDTFPSLVVEELRKAMPRLGTDRKSVDWHDACVDIQRKEPSVPGRAFFWAELKSDDFRALDPEKTIAILPVAATEQHGPHLPVMTDTAIAEGMIDLLKERLPGELSVLVLPIQAIGKSNEHLLSPGTLSLSAETLQHVLIETGEGVHRAGLRKLVLANSHGGNASVLATVARGLRVRLGMLVVSTHWRWFGLPDEMYDAAGSASRHPRRRHRDLADAIVPPRPGEHGQSQELCLVCHRHGEGIHAISARLARTPSAGLRKTSTAKAPLATPPRLLPRRGRKPPNTRSTASSRCCAT